MPHRSFPFQHHSLVNLPYQVSVEVAYLAPHEVSEPLVGGQGSRVSMRVARGSASLLPSHGRGIWPRDVLSRWPKRAAIEAQKAKDLEEFEIMKSPEHYGDPITFDNPKTYFQ